MPTPTRRPGAVSRRPATAAATSGGMTLDELNSLPDFVDETEGSTVNLDPSTASAGAIQEEEVTILNAAFRKFQYPGRDDIAPNVSLFVNLLREGQTDEDRPYEVRYNYAPWREFAASRDGNSVVRRSSDSHRQPKKTAPGVQFLQSLINAGFSVEDLNTAGMAALEGLKVGVRFYPPAEGAPENSKGILLVDYIVGDGGSDPKARRQSTAVSSAVEASVTTNAGAAKPAPVEVDEVDQEESETAQAEALDPVGELAQQAVLDILIEAGNKILISQIPTKLIRHPNWKSHEQRSSILQEVRKSSFHNHPSAPWEVKGNSLILPE